MSCFFRVSVNAGLISKFVPFLNFKCLLNTGLAKKKRWKPGMQSTGGLDIPAPPPPPPRYCIALKDFCPVGNEKSLFVILLSNLNGRFSTKCHLFVRIF